MFSFFIEFLFFAVIVIEIIGLGNIIGFKVVGFLGL